MMESEIKMKRMSIVVECYVQDVIIQELVVRITTVSVAFATPTMFVLVSIDVERVSDTEYTNVSIFILRKIVESESQSDDD